MLLLLLKNMTVVFVDTEENAEKACAALRGHALLALDMEGQQLGRNGQTSLLQLAIPSQSEPLVATTVYIFDVLALGGVLFSSETLLAPILKDPNIVKLCYDCRCDAEALFYLHGILADGLYDLQIAYTLLFQANSDPYLKGLHKALRKVLLPRDEHVLRMKSDTKKQCNFGDIMMQRPVPSAVLEYCAADVEHLFTMHTRWSCQLPLSLLSLSRQRMLQFINRSGSWCMSRLDFVTCC